MTEHMDAGFVRQAGDGEQTDTDPPDDSQARITLALKFAEAGCFDGAHHKMWVIDQMVRALTGCPLVRVHATAFNGKSYEYDAQGESAEYLEWARTEEGYRPWDVGVAP
jgi:hypothetical protein